MMFWRKKDEPMPRRDVQSEAVAAIIQGSSALPAKRLTNAVYTALMDHREISVQDLDELANRLSRLAWNRGRR